MSGTSRLPLILCLASTASLAQIEANCPVGIRATLEKSGNLLPAQRLQVTLTKWPSFDIVASRITVHGIAAVAEHSEPSETTESLDLNRIVDHPRPAPVSNMPYASTEPKEAPEGQGQLSALNEILGTMSEPILVRHHSADSRWYGWVSGFTVVNSVNLESVSYADGTSWHASDGRRCRVPVGSSP